MLFDLWNFLTKVKQDCFILNIDYSCQIFVANPAIVMMRSNHLIFVATVSFPNCRKS
jgi:hypothetical protein